MSVSYTHLDVYKRQVYNQVSRTGANIISIYEQKFYSGGGEKYQLALTRYMGNN